MYQERETMKKLYSIFITLLLLTFASNSLKAQCPYDNNFYTTLSAPSVIGASVGGGDCIYAGEYYRISGLQAGSTYRISTCNTTDVADTRVTVYAEGGVGAALTFNDDFCGLLSRVDFTPSVSGNYDVLVDATGSGNTCVSINECVELTVTLIGTSGSVSYCIPSYTVGTSNGDFINGVSLGLINNQNSGSASGPAYHDYTNLATSLNSSSSYTLAVKNNPDFSEIVSAWIDYNQDFEFSEDERLGQVSIAANGTGNINFTTASNPLAGPTRMRVRMVFSVPVSGGSVSPCLSSQFGETEDYTVNFSSDPPGPPSALTFSTACGLSTSIQDNACPNNTLSTVTVSGLTSLGTGHILTSAAIIIEHPMAADLDIYLESPTGEIVELSTDNGGSGSDYGQYTIGNCSQTAKFIMSASTPVSGSSAPFIGSYIPEGDLNNFNAGVNPNGLWKLRVCDDFSGDIGTIRYFELNFDLNATEPPACADSYTIIDGSSNVELNQILSWTAGSGNPTSYDVYFGTAVDALVLVSNNQSGTSFDPGAYNPNTTYYYQVIPSNNAGDATGCPVVSFTTVDAGATTILQSNGSVTTCAGNFFDSGGVNGNYDNNEFSMLTIYPETPGSAIEVDFTSFDLDASFDFLAIADGIDGNAPVIGLYSGNTSPGTVTATNPDGALTFLFSSDDIGTFDGWVATVNCVPLQALPECSVNNLPSDGSVDQSITSQLSWDAVSGATGYDVYFGTDANPVLVASGITEITYDPGVLLNQTIYYYKIVPVNLNGSAVSCSTYSFSTVNAPGNIILMQEGTVSTCDAQFFDSGNSTSNYSNDENTTLTISPSTANSVVEVVFNSFASEQDLDNLLIYNGSNTSGTLLQTLTGTISGPVTVTSTSSDGALTFVFSSDFQVNNAGWDATISCIALPDAPTCVIPSSPVNLASDVALDATLSWTQGVGETPDSYDVYFGTASDALVLVSDNQVGTSYSPVGLLNSTTYYWSVIASNAGGSSANNPSDCFVNSFTTIALPTTPTCPVLSGPADASTNVALDVTLSWTAGIGAPTESYNVYFGTAADALVQLSSGEIFTTYSPSSLLNNTTYYWSITATNTEGTSSNCDVYNFTTLPVVLEAPSCVVPSSPIDAAIDIAIDATISWSAGLGGAPDSYDVYFGTAADALVLVSNDQVGTSYTPTGMLNGTTYYWSVIATNTAGSSANIPADCFVNSFTTIDQVNPTDIIMQNGSVTACSGNFYDSGSLADNYSDDESYVLTVTPDVSGNLLQVNFTAFDVEQDFDSLYVYDGNSIAAPLIGAYSGTLTPFIVTSSATDGSLTFKFTSDASANFAGWEAELSCIDPNVAPSCASNLSPADLSTGIFTSPTLTWENGGGLVTGYDVYFGTASDALVLVSDNQTGTSFDPGSLDLNTTYYWQIIPSNGSLAASGCSINSFTTSAVLQVLMSNATVTTCEAEFYDSGAADNDYSLEEYSLITFLPETPNNAIQVTFNSFDLEQSTFTGTIYDSLIVYNGPDATYPIIGVYSGTTIPGPFVSSDPSGALSFHFSSDVSVTRAGWDANVICISTTDAPSCATNFAPSDLSTDVSVAPELTWTSGGGIVTGYDVYFGTASDALVLVSSAQTATSFSPGALELNTTYYWQVVPANGALSATDCSVNSFTTEAVANIIMQNNSLTVCNANFFDSGNSTSDYTSGENFTLSLLPATPGNVLEVIFSEFDLEQSTFDGTIYDSLIVYDGPDATFPVIGVYSGTTIPGPFVSTDASGALTFHFSSDISVTHAGWVASVNCIDPEGLPNCAENFSPADAATDVLVTSTSLSWTSGGGNVTGYDVYFGTDISSLPIVSPNQAGTTYSLGTLDLNTTYYWQIVPINANGSATGCSINSFTTSPNLDVLMTTATITTCAANFFDSGGPDNDYQNGESSLITFIPETPNSAIQVTFNTFDIEQSTFSSTIYDSLIVYNGPDATYPIIGVYSGTTIPGPFVSSDPSGALSFYFSSDISVAHFGWDADVACISTQDVPTCATNLSPADLATDVSFISQLSWTAPSGVVTGYDVYFGTASDALVLVSNDQVGTSYDPGALELNTTYYWQIIPVNTAGEAVGCSVQSFTTSPNADFVIFNGETTICDANLFDTGGSAGDYQLNEDFTLTIYPSTPGALIQLDFNAFDIEDGWDFLDVYYGNSATGTAAFNLTGNVLPAQIISTATDGSITLHFTSDDINVGPGFDISISCFVPTSVPECVTNPSPADAAIGSAINTSISWTAATGFPTGYDVYFGTDPSALVLVSDNQTGTSYTPSGLLAGTTYYWQIVPYNDQGSSVGCSVYSFTTGQEENVNMFTGTVTTCAANFYDSGGPAAAYQNGENSLLTFLPATPNNAIKVTFNSFDIEQGFGFYDSLIVYNGPDATFPVLGIFSGLNIPGPFVSTDPSGALSFHFSSDISVTHVGWDADVICVSTTEIPGCVINPSPADAATDVNAASAPLIWYSSTGIATGYDVYFGTDPSALALISAGQSGTSFDPGQLDLNTTYYWQIIPSNLIGSASDCQVFSFTTGGSIDVLMSNATITTCAANFYDSGGSAGTYQNNESSLITFIPATANNAIQVIFTEFNLEQSTFNNFIFDSLIVYNGPDATYPVIGIYSGTTIPGPFVSSDPSGAISFHFSSDVSVTRLGWAATVNCIDASLPPSCATISTGPADGSTDICVNEAVFTWASGPGAPATSYDVYFDFGSGLILVSDDQTASSFDPGILDTNTTYSIQIIPSNANGSAVGCLPITFTTGTCLHYCDAGATTCDEFIANVELGNINNATDCTPGGYNDYTALSADLYVGTSSPITITNGSTQWTGDQCGVWIDWNHDGDFGDANETITVTGTPGTGPYTASITPPVDAFIGSTTMRVRITFTGLVDPCGIAGFGEVEDYTINVLPALTCPFPNNILTSETTTTSTVVTWDAVTDVLEYQIRYRLASEPTTVATWSTPLVVPAPLTFTFLENLTACEDYIIQIGSVCEVGADVTFSSNINFGTHCIECTADLTPEGEDCGLDVNGGCNSGTFGSITCGETICGTSFFDGNTRDTDWFNFDVPSTGVYTVNILAEFDGTVFFADASDCNNILTPSQGNFTATEPFTLATSLTPGTYTLILVPSFDNAPFTCTGFNAYTLGLSSGNTQIAPVADVCETTPAFDLFAIPSGGIWSGTGITDASTGTFDPSVTGVGSFDVIYEAVGTGCASTDTITINVGAAPVADFVGLASTYCSTVESVVLTGIPAGGNFSISPSIPGAIAGNIFLPSLLTAGSYDVTYTVSVPNSVCSGTITQTVVIVDGPSVTIDPIAPAVCSQDAAITLSGTPSTGVFSGNGVIGSTFDPTLSGTGNQTITYTVTEAGNACPGIATTQIQVNPAPIVSISGVSGDYCLNSGAVTMIGLPALGTFLIDGVASGASFDPAVAGLGSHTLRYEFNNGTCTGFDEVTVNVVNNLSVTINNLPATICSKDDPILLTSTPAGAVFSGQGVIGGNTFDPSQVTVGSHSITATYSNGNCSATASQSIVVNPEPTASFNYSANGSSVVFSNTSSNATSYSWNFGDGSAPSTATNPTHNYSSNGSYTIQLTASSANCGDATFSVQLELSVGIGSIDGVDMIQLYPNPTSGNVMLSFNSLNQQSFEVRITDATGRLIQTEALTNYVGKFNKMFDLSDKAKGVYIFTVSSEKGSINFRVVRD